MLTPQTVNLTAAPAGDGNVAIDGALILPKAAGTIPFGGTLTGDFGQGDLRIGPVTLVFAPQGLQPVDLSPALADLRRVEGTIGAVSTVRLKADGPPETKVSLDFQDIDVEVPGVGFKALNGPLEFIARPGFATDGAQTLTARRMTGPVPLDDPRLRFELRLEADGPVIDIQEATGRFAEGAVNLSPVTYVMAAEENLLTIDLRSLSLKPMLEQFAGEQVSGTGTFSGAIPVRLTETGIIIADGLLQAETDGVLNVKWGDAREAMLAQGEEVSLMVRALEDFRYTRFDVRVARPAEGELGLALTLEGQNPEVLEGQPFVFNITLSGNLETLLGALSLGEGITTDLLRGRLGAVR